MPAFDAEQKKVLNKALEDVSKAIGDERRRLAKIVETCKPVTGANGGTDLEATLKALGKAIRTGSHE